MDTNPLNFYGATKVFGERLALSYVRQHGLSVICLRLGWIPPLNSAANVRAARPDVQRLWLSDRDFCGYVERAITVADVPFAIVNAMSEIVGSNWDLDDGARMLGYTPQDSWTPDRSIVARLRHALTDLIGRAVQRFSRLRRTG
jgi:hypothetical protein